MLGLGYDQVRMNGHDHRWWAGARISLGAVFAAVFLVCSSGCGSGPEVSEERVGSEPSTEHQTEQVSSRESEPELEPGHESEVAGEHESRSEHEGDRGSRVEHEGEHGSESEHGEELGESGIRYGIAETAREARSGVRLELRFDGASETFTGTVVNTTAEPVSRVRVEVHLSNGVELGPTPRISLAPGETSSVQLAAAGQRFEAWTTHVEIGEGEHGERDR